jgi:uncharacterized protein with ATP-grasp and redox domains
VQKLKLHLDCIPCYIRQALEAIKMVTNDNKLQENLLRKCLIAASKFDTDEIGILTQNKIHSIIKKFASGGDPYKDIKKKFNNICMSMTDEVTQIIARSNSSFETSLRIALAGNIIDFGPTSELDEEIIRQAIKQALSQRLDQNKINSLKDSIDRCKKILYIGDNAGEIVFDKIFIEQLSKEMITYVVRGGPVINDSTMEDAEMVGMTDTVRVITTGIDMPAAALPLCSREFLDEYEKSDLVIAKGQGNYEALSDENKSIFFLLKIKCAVVTKYFNGKYRVGDLVVYRTKVE